MKYKVGDRVLIKSLDWYNKNKDNYGGIYAGNGFGFWKNMTRHCGEIMKITTVKVDPEDSNKGFYFMENSDEKWTDEMIEGLVEEVNTLKTQSNNMEAETHRGYCTTDVETTNESKKVAWFTFWDNDFADKVELDLSNRELIHEDGKWFVVKKKKAYPKTYEECCKVLGVNSDNFLSIRNLYRDDGDEELTDYERDLLGKFDSLWELIICRDAYWKIAGEEMGLGKPWEPYWNDGEWKWCISYSCNCVEFDQYKSKHHTLAFPTEEMRDAFYENFKELIEQCKELL